MSRKANIILLFFSVALFFNFCLKESSAGEVNFAQAILPVRLVYLGNDGAVEKIWNNVTSGDNSYFVKFYSVSGKKEIIPTEKNFNEYESLVCRSNSSKLNTAFAKNIANPPFLENGNEMNFEINFIKKETVIEEVHTYA